MADFDLPGRYIKEHYNDTDWLCALLLYRDGHSTKAKQEFATAADLASPRRQAHFRAANANGADIYLSVNTFTPGVQSRERQEVQAVRHLFLDIDKNGGRVLHQVLNERRIPTPHTVLSSSPGKYQTLWRVSGFTVDEAEATIKGMAYEVSADQTVWDASRVLRLPGFANHKYDRTLEAGNQWSPWVSVLPTKQGTAILTPKDFPQYGQRQAFTRNTTIVPRNEKKDGVDRSLEDWKMVLNQLDAGQHPDVVQAWLKNHRPEKWQGYAKLTIENAIKHIQSKPLSHSRGHSL